jgi:hypothetical protein
VSARRFAREDFVMWTRLVAVFGLLTAAPVAAAPVSGTCTVTTIASVVRSLGFVFPITPPQGFQFPVSVDAATGAIVLDTSTWPAHREFTTFGIASYMTLPSTPVTGTIDAGGNIQLPAFTAHMETDFCTPECTIDSTFDLSTGFGAAVLSGNTYFVQGTPLDLTTGTVMLIGHGPSPDAPGGGSTSGLEIACTLAPLPTGLPKAPSLGAPSGKIKIGPALPAQPPASGPVPGDTITVKTKVKRGAAALDANNDVWIQLSNGTGPVALIMVAKADLQAKGKTLTASDSDGSVVQVLAGRKTNTAVSATLGGKLVIKSTKKAVSISLQETGLDLSTLTGSGHAIVQLGAQVATGTLTVTGTGNTRKLK